DYLFSFDPIFNSVTDEKARNSMVTSFDLEKTIPDWALAFRFDIVLRGRDGKPINDCMLEIWQADSQGRYASPQDSRGRPNTQFKGFGRSATDKDGVFNFDTVKPGAVPGPGGKPQAPHIVVCIYSRGMLRQVYTRLYFADEGANASDPILALVPADRRGTLIAHKTDEQDGLTLYRFDIRVQGGNETVFFEI